MSNIIVNITRQLAITAASSFGTALLVIDSVHAYKEYANLLAVESDFISSTDEYKFAKAYFDQDISPEKLAIAGVVVSVPADISTLLTLLENQKKNFYAISYIETTSTIHQEIDDWMNIGDRVYIQFGRTADKGGVYVNTLSERSAIYYHATASEYPDGAILGKGLAKDPGSLTWNNQIVKNVTPNDLTLTELDALVTARMNTVITKYGEVATEGGFMMVDLYIDQRRSQDFVKVTMQNNIGILLLSEDKVPYDDLGIPQVLAEVESTLNEAFTNGIIATKADLKTPDFTVSSKTRAEILATDPTAISTRVLRSITFQYVEAGAIEGAVVNGTIVAQI